MKYWLALVTLVHSLAWAQSDWPVKPIRLIVPFPAGGSTDMVARQLAQTLSASLGQAVVVDNRAGAGGNIGTDAVAKAAPDGYTVGLATSGPLANNRALYKSMPFDAQKDLSPIALLGEIPLVIVSNPALGAKSLLELLAQGKGADVSAGHPGNGTIGHLALEALKASSGLDLQAVAYKGDTPAMTDLLGGNIQLISAPVTSFLTNIQSGKLRALAVTSSQRFPGLPAVPTALEQGVQLQATVWYAVVGPAGLPAPIVNKLNAEINRFLQSDASRLKLAQLGMVQASGPTERLGQLMRAEAQKWKKVVELARISLE